MIVKIRQRDVTVMLLCHTFDFQTQTFELNRFRRYAISAIWKRTHYNRPIYLPLKAYIVVCSGTDAHKDNLHAFPLLRVNYIDINILCPWFQ